MIKHKRTCLQSSASLQHYLIYEVTKRHGDTLQDWYAMLYHSNKISCQVATSSDQESLEVAAQMAKSWQSG